MNKVTGLAKVGRPEHVLFGLPGPVVGEDGCGRVSLKERRIPSMTRWNAADQRRLGPRELLGLALDPLEEGPPDRLRLDLIEPLERHLDIERVVGLDIGD